MRVREAASLARLRASMPPQSCRLNPPQNPFIGKIELVTTENWAKAFGLPEIMMMKELAVRAPQLFRRTIVTCDLVHDSAEDVLETLTSCFAGGE